ncbi:FIST C-terminal domain-containing protein [Cereibacter sphaeroides]|uniref:FIST N-terminal domain-containing protein n=1 Tax=Cereibacter sphaeroides TaxID=1063 RepID=UPI001F2C26B5|nr:FIST N-terminal domain-containing protein [Cereibacter sphaeroides]MCE6961586.1 FIST C-terminal domain-containing protein [Cereibacter sphaeroides]MCE6968152.1 FIST C-terminal domain-containing protein [Cereibacter sphaeroides]MCE6974936.1 FIST C-terminal domain-containing protein [Cereibacter sphaeroides]
MIEGLAVGETLPDLAAGAPVVLSHPAAAPDLAARLLDGLAPAAPAAVLLFASPGTDLPGLAATLRTGLGARVIGCSSAGEFACGGYGNGNVVAVGLPARRFRADAVWLRNLSGLGVSEWMTGLRGLLTRFDAQPRRQRFGLLLIDGLSRQEELVAATVDAVAHRLPVLGGSAGDGLRFEETCLVLDGETHRDSAIFALFETDFALEQVIFDHFSPEGGRMVVTAAIPEERLILEINAEPAAEEYARLIGLDPEALNPRVFAENPLLVRMGGQYHVRAIREVTPEGGLTLMSSIETGVLLALGRADDLTHGLEARLRDLGSRPALILAFDCILRRLALEQAGLEPAVARLFADWRIAGFNTYGEQHGGVHVNQTFVGLALMEQDHAA